MSLTTIQEALAGVMRGIDGVRNAPDYPPESMTVFPFVVVYPPSGSVNVNSKGRNLQGGVTEFVIELHLAQKELGRTVESALPYFEKTLTALRADMTLSGICRINNNIDWTFGGLPIYGGVETIGFSFTLQVQHSQ